MRIKPASLVSMLTALAFLCPVSAANADISGDWTTSQGYSFAVSESGVMSGLKLVVVIGICDVDSITVPFDEIQVNEYGSFPDATKYLSNYSPSINGTVSLSAGQFASSGTYVDFGYSYNIQVQTAWCSYQNLGGNYISATREPKPTDTFTLEILKSGLGSGDVEGAGTFFYKTIVTPIAIANAGSVFTGWEPPSCGEAFPLTEDTTCTANFDVIKPPYGDVDPSSWAAGYIYAIRDEGITGGCGNGNYCPQGLVTREQMAAFLVRAVEGEPAANYCGGSSSFSDVSPDVWSCPHIKRLSELNITGGCGGGKYCPQGLVTREQMAVFIVRALEGNPSANYCNGVAPFNDVSAVSWSCGHIKRLVELGVTQGCGNGNYCPGIEVTREQMAAFLARAFLDMD